MEYITGCIPTIAKKVLGYQDHFLEEPCICHPDYGIVLSTISKVCSLQEQNHVSKNHLQVTKQFSNSGLLRFTLRRSVMSPKLALSSKPIRFKTKTNHDLVTRVFPRFKPFTHFDSAFSLAPCYIFLSSD